MAAPLCKAAWVCESADAVAADVARARRSARSGRPGPVHLSLPTDVLDTATGAAVPAAAAFEAETMPLAAAVAADVMQRLLAAQRPLILAGPASMTQSGRAALAALEAA